MKKLLALTMILGLSAFAIGCGDEGKTPAEQDPATPAETPTETE